jgi:flagellar motor protein MotB
VVCAFAEETNVSIPLTFDWLTVAWMKTRLELWLSGHPVSPRQLWLLLLLGVLSGCVPITRFEEAQSAAQVETEGRRRSESEVSQLKSEIDQLHTQMQQQTRALDEREQALSQAQLDSSTQGKQRQDAEGMVEQLRGELARVGGHLQTFHADQQKLEAALTAEAARGRALSRLARDAALALPEPIATGDYTLDPEQNAIVLRVPREKLLTEDGSVKGEAEPLLKVIAHLMQLHKTAKLRLEDSSAAGDPLAVARLVSALTERAVAAERFEALAVQPDAAPAAGPPNRDNAEIAFGFSVP